MVSEQRRGMILGVAAYGMWGLFPLYWPLLKPAGAVEILAHRIVWSLVLLVGLLALQRQWHRLGELLADRRRMRLLTVAAVVIAVNWGTYIWGVNHDHVVETSLGYFITPLVTVCLAVVVLGERLRQPQWLALGVGAVAVIVLTADYGRPPWIACVLAVSFGTYGLLKKTAGARAVEGLAVETALLVVPAVATIVVLAMTGAGTATTEGPGHPLLLVSAGAVTAVPLLCFGAAATRIPLGTLGLLQYLAPGMQLLCGVVVYDEPMPPGRLAGFVLVWIALALFTVDGLVNRSRQLRPAVEAVG